MITRGGTIENYDRIVVVVETRTLLTMRYWR